MSTPVLLWHALPCACETSTANRPDEAASAATWRELVTAARRRRALKAAPGTQLSLGV